MSETKRAEDDPRTIRLLAVDDRPEMQESLRKMLSLERDIAVIGTATSGEQAIQQAGDLRPDVILMDLNMPGMDGMAATEIITKEYPFAFVIMMSVNADAESVRSSMLAGARDFLVKPFTSEELAASIRRVYRFESGRHVPSEVVSVPVEAAPTTKRGKLITVFSPKGGTGSSTVAVNLAVALQKPGRRSVALVDANLQFGDVAALLNLRPQRSASDLVPHLGDLDAPLINAVLAPHTSGIKVLLAPSRLEDSDIVTPECMEAVLVQLLKMFDYVVVDTKGFLYDLMLKILDISDRILLLATPDIPALKGVRQFLAFVETQGHSADRYSLIINEVDRPGALGVSDIEGSLKMKVTKQLPDDHLTVMQACSEGIPFVSSSPKSQLTQAVVELAMWLMNDLEAQPQSVETARDAPRKRRWRLLQRTRKPAIGEP
jgi:pilus assembly protein CpaE